MAGALKGGGVGRPWSMRGAPSGACDEKRTVALSHGPQVRVWPRGALLRVGIFTSI